MFYRPSSWSCSNRPRSPAPRAIISCQILEESGLKAGLDFNAAFSPERVDPGRTDHTLRSTPQTHLAAAFLALAVVIGLTVAPCWPWASSSST